MPYTGADPRVFDSRDTTKFGANEERVVDLSSRRTRVRDLVVAVLGGGLMTTLVLLASHVQLGDEVASAYFAAEAVPQGHGRNVVNVILVDFRALDTLGEITVLALAAIGVIALVRGRTGLEARR